MMKPENPFLSQNLKSKTRKRNPILLLLLYIIILIIIYSSNLLFELGQSFIFDVFNITVCCERN